MPKVRHYSIQKGKKADALVRDFAGSAFNARRIAEASDIFQKMVEERECTVFFGFAGALIPAGMRHIFVDLVRDGWVDAVVTTGANLTHDLIEAAGGRHAIGSADADDADLLKKSLNRIYDVFMPSGVYEKMEDFLKDILPDIPGKEYGIRGFLEELGRRIPDRNSLLRACADTGTPLFCPAIADSGLGMQVEAWQEGNELKVDAFRDLADIRGLAWDAKKAGAMILGGGSPKNYILQALQFSPNGCDYAVQITTERPEYGGLSGATLDEAVSWGKVKEDAQFVDVICDATVAFPLVVAALKDRIK